MPQAISAKVTANINLHKTYSEEANFDLSRITLQTAFSAFINGVLTNKSDTNTVAEIVNYVRAAAKEALETNATTTIPESLVELRSVFLDTIDFIAYSLDKVTKANSALSSAQIASLTSKSNLDNANQEHQRTLDLLSSMESALGAKKGEGMIQISRLLSDLSEATKYKGRFENEQILRAKAEEQVTTLTNENKSLRAHGDPKDLHKKLAEKKAEVHQLKQTTVPQLQAKAERFEKAYYENSQIMESHAYEVSEASGVGYSILELRAPQAQLNLPTKAPVIHKKLPFTVMIACTKGISLSVEFTKWGTPVYPAESWFAKDMPKNLSTLVHTTFMKLLKDERYKENPDVDMIFASINAFKGLKISQLTDVDDFDKDKYKAISALGKQTVWGAVGMSEQTFVETLINSELKLSEEEAIETYEYLVNWCGEIFIELDKKQPTIKTKPPKTPSKGIKAKPIKTKRKK